MGNSTEWDLWFSEFAAAWRPQMQSFIAAHPDVDVSGYVWRQERASTPVPPAAAERFTRPGEDDLSWLAAALRNERQKWFVARLATLTDSMPEALFEPMLSAAIEAEDPSLNECFVTPSVKSFGAQRVHEYLARMAESDDPSTVVGALDAAYFARYDVRDVMERRELFLLEACVSEISRKYARKRILALLTEHGTRRLDKGLVAETHRELAARAQMLWDEIVRKVDES